MKGHDHNYYAVSKDVNPKIWEFLKSNKLERERRTGKSISANKAFIERIMEKAVKRPPRKDNVLEPKTRSEWART